MGSAPEALSTGDTSSAGDRSGRSSEVLVHAAAARGFMPDDEGRALFDHASGVGQHGVDGFGRF